MEDYTVSEFQHAIGVQLSPNRTLILGPISISEIEVVITGTVQGTVDSIENSAVLTLEVQKLGSQYLTSVVSGIRVSGLVQELPRITLEKGDRLYVTSDIEGSFIGTAWIKTKMGIYDVRGGAVAPKHDGQYPYNGTFNYNGVL